MKPTRFLRRVPQPVLAVFLWALCLPVAIGLYGCSARTGCGSRGPEESEGGATKVGPTVLGGARSADASVQGQREVEAKISANSIFRAIDIFNGGDDRDRIVEALVGSPREGVLIVPESTDRPEQLWTCVTIVRETHPDRDEFSCDPDLTRCVLGIREEPDGEVTRSLVLILRPRASGGRRLVGAIYRSGATPPVEEPALLQRLEQRPRICRFHDMLLRGMPSPASEPYFEISPEHSTGAPPVTQMFCGEEARERAGRFQSGFSELVCHTLDCSPDYGESNHIDPYEMWLAGARPDGSMWLLGYVTYYSEDELGSDIDQLRQQLQRQQCGSAE